MNISFNVTITDLIQAIGMAVSIPAAIFGFFKLFSKDKEKEIQLDALRTIATSQNSQIKELSKQTAQFEYQSELLRESNDFLKEQIQIQQDKLFSDKDYKEKNLLLQDRERKSKIRPYFKRQGISGGKHITLPLLNVGQRAFIDGINKINVTDVIIQELASNEIVIEHGNMINIILRALPPHSNFQNTKFEIDLLYHDEDNNKYKQKLTGQGYEYNLGIPDEI